MSSKFNESVETQLDLLSQYAAKEPDRCFTSLIHHVNEGSLKANFYALGRNRAVGVDQVSWQEYEKDLEVNIDNLLGRMKRMGYRPQPARRVYIPKDNNKTRPLGLPATEDKIVQKTMSRIMGVIYEPCFHEFSYGFRPRKSCHQALKVVGDLINFKPINHVIEADIKGSFDNVEHEKLMELIKKRISDKKFLRYLVRFLKGGYLESGVKSFGKFERENAQRQKRKANTFDFLGFTHYCTLSRKGKFKVGRRTSAKKFRKSCRNIYNWLKTIRNVISMKELWAKLAKRIRGHYQYYGVSENSRRIQEFYYQVVRMAYKILNRRSQKKSYNWSKFSQYLKQFPLPQPRIVHNFYV